MGLACAGDAVLSALWCLFVAQAGCLNGATSKRHDGADRCIIFSLTAAAAAILSQAPEAGQAQLASPKVDPCLAERLSRTVLHSCCERTVPCWSAHIGSLQLRCDHGFTATHRSHRVSPTARDRLCVCFLVTSVWVPRRSAAPVVSSTGHA